MRPSKTQDDLNGAAKPAVEFFRSSDGSQTFATELHGFCPVRCVEASKGGVGVNGYIQNALGVVGFTLALLAILNAVAVVSSIVVTHWGGTATQPVSVIHVVATFAFTGRCRRQTRRSRPSCRKM
jgi:hypothetical protein